MKYERISKVELEKMEKEFIDFLVVNGITEDRYKLHIHETWFD